MNEMSVLSSGRRMLSGEIRCTRTKTCHNATLSSSFPTQSGLGSNPSLCVERKVAAVESVFKECVGCINGNKANAQIGFVLCLIGQKPVRSELCVTGFMGRCEQVGPPADGAFI
jgi:hypothetical protein